MHSQRMAISKVFVTLILVALLAASTGFLVLASQHTPRSHSGSTSRGSVSSSSSPSSTSGSSGSSSSSSSFSSSTPTLSFSTTTAIVFPTNESFQFVEGTAGNLDGSVEINATFRSNLQTPTQVAVTANAYAATGIGNPYQFNNSIVCCPLTESYSQSEAANSSSSVNAGARSEFSSNLLFPSLGFGSYVVTIYVTTLSGTILSPMSDVFLQIVNGVAYGGQAGANGIYFDRDNGLLYVADSGIDAISIINGSSGDTVATVSLPSIIGSLQFFLFDPGNQDLYVGSPDSPLVYAIDTSNNFIASTMVTSQPGQSLSSMVYDPLDGKIFGINFVFSDILVFDDASNKLIANISGIQGPLGTIYDAESDEVLVTAYNGTTFAIQAVTNKIVGRLPTSASIFLDDPDKGLLYASENNSTIGPPAIIALNASTFKQTGPTIPLTNSSGRFEFYDHFNKDIYLYGDASFGSVGGQLIAVSTVSNSVVAKIPVPGLDEGLIDEAPSFTMNPTNGDIYATELVSPQNATVGLLHISGDSNAIVSQVFPPNVPLYHIVVDAIDGELYGIYGEGSSTVYRLDLASDAVNTIQVGNVLDYTLAP